MGSNLTQSSDLSAARPGAPALRLLVNQARLELPDGSRVGGRAVALLAYLSLGHPEGTSRDEMMDVLWDPEPGVDAGHRMRQLLYEVGRHLPPDTLVTSGRSLILRGERLSVDVFRFRTAAADGELEAAARIYEEHLLTGIAPPRASLFNEWSEAARAGLRCELASVLRAILDGDSETSDLKGRSVFARRLWELDPYDEEHAVGWIDAHLRDGDPAGALQACQLVEATFAEPGEPPPGAIRTLIGRVRGAAIQTPVPARALPPPSCVGRDGHLQDFARLLSSMIRTGRGGSVHVSGVPGIGKTRLLEEMAYLARYRDVRVWRSGCHEIESRTSYSAVIDLLGPQLREEDLLRRVPEEDQHRLAALFPVGDQSSAGSVPDGRGTTRARLNRVVASTVAAAAEMHPIVILLDDAQWADRASAEMIHRLRLVARESPILIVLCFRTENGHRLGLGTLGPPTREYELAPLGTLEIGEMLDSIGGFSEDLLGLRAELVEFLALGGGGVPLLLVELLSLLHEQGLVRVEEGVWRAAGGSLPEQVRTGPEVIHSGLRRRLEAFSHDELSTLGAVAVIGRPATVAHVAKTMGIPVHQLSHWIEQLIAARILGIDDDGLVRFSHLEMATAARGMLSSDVRREFFRTALRLAGVANEDGLRASSIEALRLACGAAAGPEATYFTLRHMAESRESWDTLVSDLTELIEGWVEDAKTRELVLGVLRDSRGTARQLRSRMRRVGRRLTLVPRPGDRWAKEASLVQLASIVGVTAIAVMLIMPLRDRLTGVSFGGGGTLVVTMTDGSHEALRFDGGLHTDAVRASLPTFVRMRDSVGWTAPSPNRRLTLFQCPGENPDDRIACSVDLESGHLSAVAESAGDDSPSGWSPDGRFVLVHSDRGSGATYNRDLFVVDARTGSARNVSNEPVMVDLGAWSPDGSRIAYVARSPGADTLRIVTTDGRRISSAGFTGNIGDPSWSPDGSALATVLTVDRDSQVVLLDVTEASVHTIRSIPGHSSAVWSPDGSILAMVSQGAPGPTGDGELVFLTGTEPGAVILRSGWNAARVEWWSDGPPAYIDEIEATPGNVLMTEGEVARLTATGLDQFGERIVLPFLEFYSRDTTIAAVDSSGGLIGRSAGSTVLSIDAGGWRKVDVPVQVLSPPQPNMVFDETWNTVIDSTRWAYYGQPAPGVIERAEGGFAMINNGDSLFPSGLVTRETFSLQEGLSIEWSQRVPLTGAQWQEIWIDIVDLGLDQFRSGPGEPYILAESLVALSVRSPKLEYQPPLAELSVNCTGSGHEPNVPFTALFPEGSWHDVALQIYPTGGCALVVDGRLVAALPASGTGWSPDTRIRLAIGGRSHMSEVLVDDVWVWTGVRWKVGPDGIVTLGGAALNGTTGGG